MKSHNRTPLAKLALVLLVNLLVPALGNLIFIGRTAGNFACLFIGILAMAGQDLRIMAAWSFFMNVRAFVDIYVMPRRIAAKNAEIQKSGRVVHGAGGDFIEGAWNCCGGKAGGHEPGCRHRSDETAAGRHEAPGDFAGLRAERHLEQIEPAHGELLPGDHHLSHGDAIPLKNSHDQAPVHKNEVSCHLKAELPELTHGAPVSLSAGKKDDTPDFSADLPLLNHQAVPAHKSAHKEDLPLRSLPKVSEHEYSHGAPLPLNLLHSSCDQDLLPVNPLPLKLPDCGSMPGPASPEKHSLRDGESHQHEPGVASESHQALINQHRLIDSLMSSQIPEAGEKKETHCPLQNPHDALNAVMHSSSEAQTESSGSGPTAPDSQTSLAHHAHLHAQASVLAEIEQPSAGQNEAVEDTDAGMIFDLYGDDEGDEAAGNRTGDELVFCRKAEEGSEPEPVEQAWPGSSQDQDRVVYEKTEAHVLKQVGRDVESICGVEKSGSRPIELCPTCQKPRLHNRPTCPACGTRFENNII